MGKWVGCVFAVFEGFGGCWDGLEEWGFVGVWKPEAKRMLKTHEIVDVKDVLFYC